MEQTPKQIHEEVTKLLATFRPEFGNPAHIELVKEIQKLGALNKEFQKEVEAVQKLKRLQLDIRTSKKQILFLFRRTEIPTPV